MVNLSINSHQKKWLLFSFFSFFSFLVASMQWNAQLYLFMYLICRIKSLLLFLPKCYPWSFVNCRTSSKPCKYADPLFISSWRHQPRLSEPYRCWITSVDLLLLWFLWTPLMLLPLTLPTSVTAHSGVNVRCIWSSLCWLVVNTRIVFRLLMSPEHTVMYVCAFLGGNLLSHTHTHRSCSLQTFFSRTCGAPPFAVAPGKRTSGSLPVGSLGV